MLRVGCMAKSTAYYARKPRGDNPEWPALASLAKASRPNVFAYRDRDDPDSGGIGFTWDTIRICGSSAPRAPEIFSRLAEVIIASF